MNTSAAALLAIRAFRQSSSPIKSNNNSWTVRTFATSSKQKAGPGSKATSSGSGTSSSEPKLPPVPEPPSNVFKQVDKSALGPPGTSKEGGYKNPEYFSYHKMSYTDMELVMANLRVPQPSNKKK